jgi:hypothetical protein
MVAVSIHRAQVFGLISLLLGFCFGCDEALLEDIGTDAFFNRGVERAFGINQAFDFLLDECPDLLLVECLCPDRGDQKQSNQCG